MTHDVRHHVEQRRKRPLERARRRPVIRPSSTTSSSEPPRRATSSAICSADRVAVPSSSIAAVKLASPGLSIGFAPLPVFTHEIRRDDRQPGTLVDEDGQAIRQLKRGRHRQPEASSACPGLGASLRHASSGLIDSAPPAAAPLASPPGPVRRDPAGRERRGPRRAPSADSCSAANALTDAGVTSRYRWMSSGRNAGIAEVVVVHVEAIGDAAKSAERLEPLNDSRFDDVARALDLRLIGA